MPPASPHETGSSQATENVANARQHECAQRIVDHAFVVNRLHLLEYSGGSRVRTRARLPRQFPFGELSGLSFLPSGHFRENFWRVSRLSDRHLHDQFIPDRIA